MNKIISHKFEVIISLLYLLSVILNIKNVDIGYNISDSPSYFDFSLNNPLRMPVITFIFSRLLYFGAIVIFQSILSYIAWTFLASTISNLIENIFVRKMTFLLIVLLATSSQVMEHNFIILSESLTISSLILSFCFLVKVIFSKNSHYFLLLSLSLLFFAGIKQSNSYYALITWILAFIFLIMSKKFNILVLVSSIIFLPLSTFLLYIGNQNYEIKNNLLMATIIERSFDDLESQSYWEKYDFPSIAYQIYSSEPNMNPIDMLNNSPQIKAWLRNAPDFIIETKALKDPLFLIFGPVNPDYFIKVFTDYESILNIISTGSTNISESHFLNADTDSLEPYFLNKLLVSPTIFWPNDLLNTKFFMIFFLAITLISLVILNYSSWIKLKLFLFLNLSLIFIFFAIWSTWHITVTYEMKRYLVPWAIMLRIIFIWVVSLNADFYLARRRK